MGTRSHVGYATPLSNVGCKVTKSVNYAMNAQWLLLIKKRLQAGRSQAQQPPRGTSSTKNTTVELVNIHYTDVSPSTGHLYLRVLTFPLVQFSQSFILVHYNPSHSSSPPSQDPSSSSSSLLSGAQASGPSLDISPQQAQTHCSNACMTRLTSTPWLPLIDHRVSHQEPVWLPLHTHPQQ